MARVDPRASHRLFTAYLNENADSIRSDWPRIPLPSSKEVITLSGTRSQSSRPARH